MTLKYRAAVLHQAGKPLAIEQVSSGDPAPTDVVVRVRAAGLCHTDLEVIDGSLRYPLPMILGHEAAGVVEQIGPEVDTVKVGDHVILSWNPHCGHCFQCNRGQPILCDTYLGEGPKGLHFDGRSKASLGDGVELKHLMFLGAFAEICTVPAQQAIVVPKEIPFDRACLIGCGVMTGVGAALNVADIAYGDTVMVIGCGAVGLAALQGAAHGERQTPGPRGICAIRDRRTRRRRGAGGGRPSGCLPPDRGGRARRRPGDMARQDRCRQRR